MTVILGALLTAALAESSGERINVKRFLVPGLLVTAVGIYWLAHITSETPWWLLVAPLAVAGAGIGAVSNPQRSEPSKTVSRERPPSPLGNWPAPFTSGGSVLVSLPSRQSGRSLVSTAFGVNSALVLCAIVAAVAAGAALMLPVRREA